MKKLAVIALMLFFAHGAYADKTGGGAPKEIKTASKEKKASAKQMDKLLKDLLMCDGISGYEENAAKIISAELSKTCGSVETDNMGNVYGKTGKGSGSSAKKIMITAHMDEVGMIVKYINEQGYIYFIKVGGITDGILPGRRVEIINKKGGRITGIIGIKPPHVMSAEEAKQPVKYDDMFIDTGLASKEEVLKVIDIGDQIIFEPNAGVLNGDFMYGKAVDNRIGCYALIKVMEKLPKDIDAEIYAVATVQEEIGLKGAKTSSFKINPDFALVIDTTISGDVPGIDEKASALKLGKGAAITSIEASGGGSVVPAKVRKIMTEAAEANKIPYQTAILAFGATDGAAIYTSREGILTGVISIPTRYIHAPSAVFHMKDIESAVDLAVKTIEKAVKELK